MLLSIIIDWNLLTCFGCRTHGSWPLARMYVWPKTYFH